MQDCNPSSSRLSSSDQVFLVHLVRSALVPPVVARSSSIYNGAAARSRVHGSPCCQVQAVDPYRGYISVSQTVGRDNSMRSMQAYWRVKNKRLLKKIINLLEVNKQNTF
ncbi:hypothetical protein TNCV_2328901 [Trichonephila clavipes]|nr:hypothetical protein TNCV_2328901 [Trichonephila clavipes]